MQSSSQVLTAIFFANFVLFVILVKFDFNSVYTLPSPQLLWTQPYSEYLEIRHVHRYRGMPLEVGMLDGWRHRGS